MADVTGANLLVNIKAAISDFKNKVGTVKDEVGGITSKFETGRASVNKYGPAVLGVVGAVGGALALAASKSIEFNTGLANLQTMVGNNDARMVEWKGNIQDLSVAMGSDVGGLTDGAYQVVSAFGDTADSMDILKIAAKGATAGSATTTDAINLLSAVSKGYNDTSAESIQKISDLSFKTVQLGQTDFPQLASSIGKIVPIAAEMNVSQEELFASMATLTGVTGGAAEVSTQLRGAMQSLMVPTKDMDILIADLGFSSGKALIEQEGLQGAMEIVTGVAKASGQPLAKYISSIEGQTAALALTGSQVDVYKDKLEAMNEASGATEDAFLAQTEGINETGFAIEQAKAQFSIMLTTFGDVLLPLVGDLALKMTGLFQDTVVVFDFVWDWLTKLPDEISTVIGSMVTAFTGFLTSVEEVWDAVKTKAVTVVTSIYDKFRWFLDKLGIELPEIDDMFEDTEEAGKGAAEEIQKKWTEKNEVRKAELKEETELVEEEGDKQVAAVEVTEEEKKVIREEKAAKINEAVERANEARREREKAAEDAAEEKKRVKAEKENEKKIKELEKQEKAKKKEDEKREKEHIKFLQDEYKAEIDEKLLSDAELAHAAHMEVLGENWQGYLDDRIIANTPGAFDIAFEGVEENFNARIDNIGDAWVDSLAEGGSLGDAMTFMGESIKRTFEAAFIDIQGNIITGFFDFVKDGLKSALKGLGKSVVDGFLAGSGGGTGIVDIGKGLLGGASGGAGGVGSLLSGAGGLLASAGGLAVAAAPLLLAAAVGYGAFKAGQAIAKKLGLEHTSQKDRSLKAADAEDHLAAKYAGIVAAQSGDATWTKANARLMNEVKHWSDRDDIGAEEAGSRAFKSIQAQMIDMDISPDQSARIAAIAQEAILLYRSGELNAIDEANTIKGFHSGGVVGSGGTPFKFANLLSNEVPAVLQRGEEVLTADDPRHVNNNGFGDIFVEVKGNYIDSLLNAREVGRSVADGIFNEMKRRTKVGRF